MLINNGILYNVEKSDIIDGTVIIPNNVLEIGSHAFENLNKLIYLTLPNGITKINSSAFKNCRNLENIKIPNTVNAIDESAFSGCAKLNNVELPKNINEISDYSFYGCVNLSKIELPKNISSIGKNAFMYCQSLKHISIPENVKVIKESAFARCDNLKNITLPKDMDKISDCTFMECLNLKIVKLPSHLKEIGKGAFLGCSNLKSISFPSTLSNVNDQAFYECVKLKKVNTNPNLKNIGLQAFKSCVFSKFDFPKNLETIKDQAFQDCINLKSASINDNTTSLGEGLFSNCENLKMAKLPSTITAIPNEIFVDCKVLDNIAIPNSVKTLGTRAFSNCKNLKSINIPDSVKTIEKLAFADCTNLSNVAMSKNLEQISEGAFLNCLSLQSIDLPDTLTVIENNAFCACTDLSDITIPRNLKVCEDDAFKGSIYINDLVFPKSIEKLGSIDLPNIRFFGMTKDGYRFSEIDFSGSKNLYEYNIKPNILISNKKYFEMLSKEQKNYYVSNFYNYFLFGLPKDKQQEFFDSHNFTFFKKLAENYNFNSPALYRFIYNLGGLSSPIEVNGKKIDYAQKVGNFLISKISKEDLDLDIFGDIGLDMTNEGFKKEFTDFFIENYDKLKVLECRKSGFVSRCYNDFETVQSTNTSNRGNQRQLKATVEKFESYYKENKFSGITSETKPIADLLSKYYYKQETFDYAVKIFKEKNERQTPANILNIDLKEDPFKNIDELANETKKLQTETLQNLNKFAEKEFTYEWLSKNDPTNLILGKLCNCCAHIEGVGYGFAHASITEPNVQNLVIRDKNNKIIAKSILYINTENCYGICNSIAVNEHIGKDKYSQIYKKVKQGVNDFVEEYNREHPDKKLTQINVGLGSFNPLSEQIRLDKKVSLLKLNPLDFSKFGPQDKFNYMGDCYFDQGVLWTSEENKEQALKIDEKS